MIKVLYNTMLESAPYIIMGFLIAGIFRFWIPSGVLQRHLGARKPAALFKSVGVGCVLPMCSCGTIPLGIGLYKSGASIGNMLAFMTSTPILSPILIVLSLTLLGTKLTVILISVAILGSLTMGLTANKLLRKNSPKGNGKQNRSDKYIRKTDNKQVKSKLGKALRWSFLDFGADISVDILIGLGMASILLTFLPLEWISTWLGQQEISTLFYVILLGLPVYACSIPSIPVVQGLLLLGASPGAAVAYMIAGPATNLGELNAIRHSMGNKASLFYAVALILIALMGGFITDQMVFPDYQYHAFRQQGELVVQQCCVPLIFGEGIGDTTNTTSFPLWHYPFGILLFAVIAYGLFKKTKYFFINPCKGCSWKAYGTDGTCGSICHLRRKYLWIKKRS